MAFDGSMAQIAYRLATPLLLPTRHPSSRSHPLSPPSPLDSSRMSIRYPSSLSPKPIHPTSPTNSLHVIWPHSYTRHILLGVNPAYGRYNLKCPYVSMSYT